MRSSGAIVIFFVIVPSLCEFTKGFIENPEDGHSYKIMYQAQTWTNARDTCANIRAKLAVPKSKEQFAFIQKILRRMHLPSVIGSRYKLLVWLGISNIDDYSVWKNVDGENIQNTGFHTWASQQNGLLSNDPRSPHCVGMDAMNIGLRDWWCHHRQPYICEITAQTNRS